AHYTDAAESDKYSSVSVGDSFRGRGLAWWPPAGSVECRDDPVPGLGDRVAQAHETTTDRELLATACVAPDDLPLFGKVLDDEIGQAFRTLIDRLRDDEDPRRARVAWGRLFALLAAEVELSASSLVGDAWQNHLLDRLLTDENPFSHKAQRASLGAM